MFAPEVGTSAGGKHAVKYIVFTLVLPSNQGLPFGSHIELSIKLDQGL